MKKKLCTYPRTDSQYLSDDMEQTAGNGAKDFIPCGQQTAVCYGGETSL